MGRGYIVTMNKSDQVIKLNRSYNLLCCYFSIGLVERVNIIQEVAPGLYQSLIGG